MKAESVEPGMTVLLITNKWWSLWLSRKASARERRADSTKRLEKLPSGLLGVATSTQVASVSSMACLWSRVARSVLPPCWASSSAKPGSYQGARPRFTRSTTRSSISTPMVLNPRLAKHDARQSPSFPNPTSERRSVIYISPGDYASRYSEPHSAASPNDQSSLDEV